MLEIVWVNNFLGIVREQRVMKCDLDIAEENFLLESKQNEFFIAKCMWICAQILLLSLSRWIIMISVSSNWISEEINKWRNRKKGKKN